MACIQTFKSIALDCQKSVGGIKEIYIVNRGVWESSNRPITFDDDERVIQIQASGSSPIWNVFSFKKNTGTMTTNINTTDDGMITYITEISLSFNKQEWQKRLALEKVTVGELMVCVHDSNDDWWLIGYDYPASVSAISGETGQNLTDTNKYSLTIQETSLKLPYFIKTKGDTQTDTNYVDMSTIHM